MPRSTIALQRRVAELERDVGWIVMERFTQALAAELPGQPVDVVEAVSAAFRAAGTPSSYAEIVAHMLRTVGTVSPEFAEAVARRLGMEPAEVAAG